MKAFMITWFFWVLSCSGYSQNFFQDLSEKDSIVILYSYRSDQFMNAVRLVGVILEKKATKLRAKRFYGLYHDSISVYDLPLHYHSKRAHKLNRKETSLINEFILDILAIQKKMIH